MLLDSFRVVIPWLWDCASLDSPHRVNAMSIPVQCFTAFLGASVLSGLFDPHK